MSIEENRQAVADYFTTVGNGEEGAVQSAVARFADDVTWHIPPSLPNGGAHTGKAAVLAMLGAPGGMALYRPGSMDVEVEATVADGDRVVVPLVLRAVTRRGEPYENRYVFVFRLVSGRIAEVWEHLDTLHLHRSVHAETDGA